MITSGVSFDATTHSLVRNHARNQRRVDVAVEQLSTGKRINRPADDPSGFVAAEQIRGELRDLEAQGRVATFGRINSLRRQAAWADVPAQQQHDSLDTDTSLAESDGGELPINLDPRPTIELPSNDAGLFAANGRIDEVFSQLRGDKEVILTETLSQIEDTDFAVATADLAQGQVLTNASVAALAYATQRLTDQMTKLMETIDATVQ